MPIIIPIILGGIAAASAAHGVKKGVDAAHDFSAAKERSAQASLLSESAQRNIKITSERAIDRLEKLANTKIDILVGSMTSFVTNFERIKNVNFQETEGINELKNFGEYKQELLEIKQTTMTVKEFAMGSAASIAGGALLSYGTKAAVLGAVTHGGLAGAAATNHTLALLGGGAKAIGGFGMAGGSVVLGGLIAGPALSLAGSIFASQAKTKLNNAESEYAQAEALNEQAINTCIVLNGIMVRASQLAGILKILNQFFTQSVQYMCNIIDTSGEDYNRYSVDQKKAIYACVQLALTIKAIIDTTLLNADGELEQQSFESLMRGQEYIAQLEAM